MWLTQIVDFGKGMVIIMTDEQLLILLREKPEQGVHEMMNSYGGAIATICRNFLYDFSEHDIEETIADTFIHFWRHLDRFELKKGYTIKSYLYAIARNASKDRRRKAKKEDIFSIEELALDLPVEYDFEQEIQRREYEAILHTCLENMKEPDKSVFLYRYFYGYRVKDIAEKLGLSTKQVENILYRGKEKLRNDLLERGIVYE